MAKTHTWQRTAKLYREKGYLVAKTEYTSRGHRHDLLGFIDGLALGPGHIIALQACGTDFQEHVRKMCGPCRAEVIKWLQTGNEIHLVGWRKLKTNRNRWTPRIEHITLDYLGA